MGEDKKLPVRIYQGVVKIAGKDLSCAVLDDGTRVLTNKAIFEAFNRPRRGRSKGDQRAANMPSFIDANNLKPFTDAVFHGGPESYEVVYTSMNGNAVYKGYNAEILPLICEIYLRARDAGNVLTDSQKPLAIASDILMRSLAKIGIIALIDEATGYQEVRAKNELQKILAAYISEELIPWTKRFPDEFYENLFRLHGWQYNPLSVKRPSYVGKLTMDLIYNQLPPGVADELKKKTPRSTKGNYTKRFHQGLTTDIGNPHLEKQVAVVITLMKISPNWETFMAHFNRAFGGQLQIEEFLEDKNKTIPSA